MYTHFCVCGLFVELSYEVVAQARLEGICWEVWEIACNV